MSTDSLFRGMPNGEMVTYVFTNYNAIDSGLNKKGKYYSVACGIDHIDNWANLSEDEYKKRKNAWLEAIVKDLDKQFPGIGDTVVYKEMATARTVRDYINTPDGVVYGFDPSAPFVTKPLSSKTKVKGLYLASAFGSHGGGVTGALLSGEQAVIDALKDMRKK